MILVIISIILIILSLVTLVVSYNWEKSSYKGWGSPVVFMLMSCALLCFMKYQDGRYYKTSNYRIEKTIKTVIIDGISVKNDTLIKITHK
jgi:hypothetical protein